MAKLIIPSDPDGRIVAEPNFSDGGEVTTPVVKALEHARLAERARCLEIVRRLSDIGSYDGAGAVGDEIAEEIERGE